MMELALACFVLAGGLRVLGWIVWLFVPRKYKQDRSIPTKAGVAWEQDEPWEECFDEMEDL